MTDVELILKLAESDCLYARAGKSARQVMIEARPLTAGKPWIIIAALLGQATGHEWCACSRCGEIRMMDPTGLKSEDLKRYTEDPPPAHPYCKMTPGCLGHMVRLAKRPTLTKRVKEALIDYAEAD